MTTVIDIVITAIATLPAVIAAISSLRNGRTLRNGTNGRQGVGLTNNPKPADWYGRPKKPPMPD